MRPRVSIGTSSKPAAGHRSGGTCSVSTDFGSRPRPFALPIRCVSRLIPVRVLTGVRVTG
jgi:hypothetical protein